MENDKSNNKILKSLDSFESLETLNSTEEWNQKLIYRLDSVKPYKSSVISFSKFTFAILIITILNIGIILTAIFTDSKKSLSRDNALEIISKEMLVNPNLLNK